MAVQDQRMGTRPPPEPRGEAEGGGCDGPDQAGNSVLPGQDRVFAAAKSSLQDLQGDHQEPAGREDQGLQE
eukprot:7818172-Heterocapsa_arctica.AAC.1